MSDPRLNSVHLEAPRRQEFRQARDALLRARGSHTICSGHLDESQLNGLTAIHKAGVGSLDRYSCWLTEGEFIYPLRIGVNTMGRSSDNDVVLADAYASRRHCALLLHSDDRCELHDTASKNGTTVNGQRVSGPVVLKSGDEIRIADQLFAFRTRGGDAEAPFPSATLGD
jgi:hypothetical protein